MTKYFVFYALILFTLIGCERSGQPTAGSADDPIIQEAEQAVQSQTSKPAPVMQDVKVPAKSTYVVGFSQCTVAEPWRVQMNKDIETAAAKYPTLQLKTANAEDQIDKQVSDIQNFISQGVDFIIISPKETAQSLTEAVAKAYQKGIPVIVLDRQVLGDQYTCFIGADNYKIGRAAGEFIKKILNGKGKIVELKGNMSSTPGQTRHKGFLSAIVAELKSRQIQIVHSADTDWKEEKARAEMESALAANPQIDLVYGHNDPAAHGAYVAAKQAGRADQIKFVGIDALSHEGIAYVKEGALNATVEYPTGGDRAIQVILDIIAAKPIPRTITLGTRLFTRENVTTGGEAIE